MTALLHKLTQCDVVVSMSVLPIPMTVNLAIVDLDVTPGGTVRNPERCTGTSPYPDHRGPTASVVSTGAQRLWTRSITSR